MKKEVEELKKEIDSLKSELEASLRREDVLLHRTYGLGYVKQKLKNTSVGRAAANPNSVSGKIIRLPRTAYRIVMHPSIIKDIKNKNIEKVEEIKEGELEDILVPIKFFIGDDDSCRVNLILPKIEEDMLRLGIEIANKEKLELRVVTYNETANPMFYSKLLKAKKVPKADNISFYSSVDQAKKMNVFELEVGKNDIFLTRAWRDNEREKKNK